MLESNCCGASSSYISSELCGECLEHCEFEDEEDYPCDIINEF
tara:strand:- start:79 stop:207 length:129 start_codon:yes stop_codon:yes gene_type:complete